jgi:hypothetical protein
LTHSFLLLSALFLIPGAVIFVARPDLRRVIGLMALCSIPFAFTESLFYPTYWEPKFLFDLADRIGFGVEDLLFVVGLSAFTSTSYAFFTGSRYEPLGPWTTRRLLGRSGFVLAITLLATGLLALLRVPMIYGSFGIMIGVSGALCLLRRDLLRPALGGGLFSLGVYTPSGGCCPESSRWPGTPSASSVASSSGSPSRSSSTASGPGLPPRSFTPMLPTRN